MIELLTESLWPTRCVLCDLPGTLLCQHCQKSLGYIDILFACPLCGAPFGKIQCCHCSPTIEENKTLQSLDYCMSVGNLKQGFGTLVSTYKDKNEQRLSSVMAHLLCQAIPRAWISSIDALTTIPDSIKSRRKRGFDHMIPIAKLASEYLAIPYIPTLSPPRTKDQRLFGRQDRFKNMTQAFTLACTEALPNNILIIDDVFTTGATLNAASCVLKAAGVQKTWGATLARS